MEFVIQHWNKCLKERGIELSWSSTEKVLIPSVTDEVGQSGFSLDDGESPAPATAAVGNNSDADVVNATTTSGEVTDGMTEEKAEEKIDEKTDDQNGMSMYTIP